ncbi:hypothetical protein M378DRAFT_797051 [Amanita muscaria Koide BX008]|uniref:Uncharacterized protein n=1 Tax=Amanita muscaria (strain Koide BX008) TaxID=946122 RepID=A0A0C2X0M7_AMAMK|nr:hypothetical protein M378DRAFT_797051 [Amanita muscaria Koide BX008]
MTPTISKSSKRKSKQKTHPKLRIAPVKKELPEIDLSVPMPPPSPTDDPILLSGPSGPFLSSSSRTGKSVMGTSTQTDFLPTPSSNDDLESEVPAFFDWREHTRPVATSSSLGSSSFLDIHPSDVDVIPVDLPVFRLNDLPPSSDAWSDSDDDTLDHQLAAPNTIEEGESEYTGRWKTLLVRTKQDPPSSVTRARMEQWGRPISPFPEEAKSMQLLNGEDDVEEARLDEVDQAHQDALEEEEVLRISLEPDDAPANVEDTRVGEQEEYILDTLIGTQVADLNLPHGPDSAATHTEDHPPIGAAGNAESEHDESSGDEGEESFVTISSADPHAAARAAAILKQYNYDCFTSKSKRRQSGFNRTSRRVTDVGEALARKGVAEGRIEKQRPQRRSSVGTGVIGTRVFVSGVPVTTLGSLLQEAEAEVSFSFNTPQPPANSTFEASFSALPVSDRSLLAAFTQHGGERHWTKDDWKLLDSCFTDERMVIGSENELADVDAVDLDKVVQRYIGLLGGEDIMQSFGNGRDRESILQRAKALRRKQCAGNVAPPTTPLLLHPSSFGMFPTSDIDVPDFTPLKERVAFKQAIRADGLYPTMYNVSQSFLEGEAEFRTPFTPHSLSLGGTTAVDDSLATHADLNSFEHDTTLLHYLDVDHSSNAAPPTTPATFGGRVKGFLHSYLPSLSKLKSHSRSKAVHPPPRPGLPLPPPELLEKPRGPVATPARPQLPKSKPPKELVQLHPAPLPAPKTSKIPRLAAPQRLVKLNPVPLPEPREAVSKFKPRRSSGSVKDLIHSFEELEKTNGEESLKSRKPTWRP